MVVRNSRSEFRQPGFKSQLYPLLLLNLGKLLNPAVPHFLHLQNWVNNNIYWVVMRSDMMHIKHLEHRNATLKALKCLNY